MTSTLTVDPRAVEEVGDHGSAAVLVVRDCSDAEAALTALRLAAADLWAIPHPLEPGDGLPNWVSVAAGTEGPQVFLDLKDLGPVVATQVVDVVAARLRAAGIGGTLGPGDPDTEDDDEVADDEPAAPGWSPAAAGLRGFPADLPEVAAGAEPSVRTVPGPDGRDWTRVEWTVPRWRCRPDDLTDALHDTGWRLTRPGNGSDPGDATRARTSSSLRLLDAQAWLAERGDERLGVVSWIAVSRGLVVVSIATPRR